MADFSRQTYTARELLVLHDGGEVFNEQLQALASSLAPADIRVEMSQPGMQLGGLRNLALQLAAGELICQWDDDDRYHPQRLELQHGALVANTSDFCFLTDQLHWFEASGELSWDDWRRESYPLDFVQGTLLGLKSKMPVYPDIRRGEDAVLCLEMLKAGNRITRLQDAGWCYVYVYHGHNCFEQPHHAAIARSKCLSAAQMVSREASLRTRLSEYSPPLTNAFYQGPGIRLDF